MSKPSPICELQQGRALGADCHRLFRQTFNWLARSWSELTCGPGIVRENGSSDAPQLQLKLKGSSGIVVENDGDAIRISYDPDADDTEAGGSGSSGYGGHGGGTGGGGTGGGSGSGTASGGGAGGGGGYAGGTGSSGADAMPSGNYKSNNCNTFSEAGEAQDSWSEKPGNEGDDCNTLNGW